MIAARALMNLIAQAAYLELCLGLGRPISAVRVNIRRRIGFVQKSIEFLTVMHARVGIFWQGTALITVWLQVRVLPGPAMISNSFPWSSYGYFPWSSFGD